MYPVCHGQEDSNSMTLTKAEIADLLFEKVGRGTETIRLAADGDHMTIGRRIQFWVADDDLAPEEEGVAADRWPNQVRNLVKEAA